MLDLNKELLRQMYVTGPAKISALSMLHLNAPLQRRKNVTLQQKVVSYSLETIIS